ncbi:Sir2 family NAD-dependent protein deacetylase [Ferrimicrobium sp.]|uniref:SIR2 family NAD-dependent protein deacylase n=1 Tax=Ferrimicrobium sp. TaxID=2926050 RepID=UPI002631372E|nr:Sir2 family NAD-dependent protein deacetylase [Ferrimicrobium sp.]
MGSLVAFTGAGLSTAAGIPDYRGPNGVWTKDPSASKLSRVSQYRNDSELRRRLWKDRLTNPLYRAKPTTGHRCLEVLTQTGALKGVITQNVDGLHRLSDGFGYPLIELHGCIHETRCLDCGAIEPMDQALARVAHGELDPTCLHHLDTGHCGGILTSNTVTFGEPVPLHKLEHAQLIIKEAHTLLVLGSTLSVNPAARLVAFALEHGRQVVVVNQGPTRYDNRGVLKIDADCQEFLHTLTSSIPQTVVQAPTRSLSNP